MREPDVSRGGYYWAQGHVLVQLPRTLLRAGQGIVVQLENRKRPLRASFVKTWLIGLTE